MATFSECTSTTRTRCPALASPVAGTHATSPSKKMLTRMTSHQLFAPGFKLPRYLRPRVPLRHQTPSRVAERLPAPGIAEERHCGGREGGGIIRGHEVPPGSEGETFCADLRRHDRLPHGQRLEPFEARASRDSPRSHIHRR